MKRRSGVAISGTHPNEASAVRLHLSDTCWESERVYVSSQSDLLFLLLLLGFMSIQFNPPLSYLPEVSVGEVEERI